MSTVNDRFSGHRFSGNDCFSGKKFQKTTVLEENKLVLFSGFEDTTALEDKKGLTVFSAKPVVHCICEDLLINLLTYMGVFHLVHSTPASTNGLFYHRIFGTYY